MSKVPKKGDGAAWLKSSEIKEGETVKIVGEANWETSTYQGREQHQYIGKVMHGDVEKKMKFTMKSCENISSVYGEDSNEWIGKTIVLTLKELEINGKDVLTIRAFPVDNSGKAVSIAVTTEKKEVQWDE